VSQFISEPSTDAMATAASHLVAGGLVAFPTETVYGLGADACNAMGVARIYEVKGRPADHPLIVHMASMSGLGEWAREVPGYAILLACDFWPGPMTLVLKRSSLAKDFITGGQDTVGLRVPDHLVALALLEAFENLGGKGIAAPSANRFGQVSPTTAAAVAEEIGEFLDSADQIIDGGACAVGVESTIIDCTGDAPRILRPGAITASMIEQSTGIQVTELIGSSNVGVVNNSAGVNSDEIIRVSGSFNNHYAPAAKVLLCEIPTPGQGFIAHANMETPAGVSRLASPHNDEEFAQILYSALREADAQGLKEVVVMQPIGIGIAVAIRDRLARAANGR
jgi:L-threonylcarbamoyladenylate synthase